MDNRISILYEQGIPSLHVKTDIGTLIVTVETDEKHGTGTNGVDIAIEPNDANGEIFELAHIYVPVPKSSGDETNTNHVSIRTFDDPSIEEPTSISNIPHKKFIEVLGKDTPISKIS